jgi:ComF family protein
MITLFGKRCVFCEGVFKPSECEWNDRRVCICGRCMSEIDGQDVKRIVDTQKPLAGAIPCVHYTGAVREAIRRYKFRDQRAYAPAFEYLIRKKLYDTDIFYPFDAIVTLPLSPERMKERGYNQSEFVSRAVSELCGVTVHNEYLSKPKNIARQSSLNYYERIINVSGAYRASAEVKGKNIIITDDIYTSGATLAEAARTLIAAGAKTVTGVVFSTVPKYKRHRD